MMFVCISDIKTEWFFNDGFLPSNAIYDSSNRTKEHKLKIINATIYNEGFYECKGVIDLKVVRARGELKVIGKFPFNAYIMY